MNNAEKVLVGQLAPALAGAGFNWLKRQEMFIRKEPHGFSSFSWASYPTGEDGGRLELVPLLGVRHDVVEDAVNELGLIHGDDNKKFTATIDRGLGFFPFDESKDYKQYIRLNFADADIQKAAASISFMLGDEGREFFEKYSSLRECSQGLNDPIQSKTHPLCNNFPRRVYCGVAAAFFAENHRVPELVRQYLEFAKNAQPNKYEQIAILLDQLISIVQHRSRTDHERR